MNAGAAAPPPLEPFFLDTGDGQRFCILHRAATPVSGRGVVFVHAFAEEMNKSRRMAALQSRALASHGFTVLQMDLFGCGDSPGDFRDMTWARWRNDVSAACAWLLANGCRDVTLWGLRLGALLAVHAAIQCDLPVRRFVLWQPVTAGDLVLRQFLRLRVAGAMLTEGRAGAGVGQLLDELIGGHVTEVGGYELSPEFAVGLSSLKLADLRPNAPVAWLELVSQQADDLPPVSRRIATTWQESGVALSTRCVVGPNFWNTLEITCAPQLISATVEAMLEQ